MDKRVMVCGLMALSIAAADVSRANAQAATARAPYDSGTPIAYRFARTPDGGIRVTGDAPQLHVEKTTYADGRFVLRMASGRDQVTVAMSHSDTRVTRAGRTIAIANGAGDAAGADRARAMLGASAAVKRFVDVTRAAARAAGPERHAFVAASAVVRRLLGDRTPLVDLTPRAADAGRDAGVVLRRARLGGEDCWETYERNISNAWSEFDSCRAGAASYGIFGVVVYKACEAEWILHCESAWFQAIGCSALRLT